MRYAAPWITGDQFELVGEMFRRSSVAVATTRAPWRSVIRALGQRATAAQ